MEVGDMDMVVVEVEDTEVDHQGEDIMAKKRNHTMF